MSEHWTDPELDHIVRLGMALWLLRRECDDVATARIIAFCLRRHGISAFISNIDTLPYGASEATEVCGDGPDARHARHSLGARRGWETRRAHGSVAAEDTEETAE